METWNAVKSFILKNEKNNFLVKFLIFVKNFVRQRLRRLVWRSMGAWYSHKVAKTLSITTLSITKFSIMTLSITTLSIIVNKLQHSAYRYSKQGRALLCWVSLMLSVTYAECHLCWVSFTSPFALSVVMLSVVMLSVVAPHIATYELLKTTNFEVAPCNESYVDFLGYG